MTMKHYSFLVIYVLLLPLTVSAQLTSPNYIVTGQGFATGGFTTQASSTNFQNDPESGPVFVYDVASTTTSGGGSGTATTPPTSSSTSPTATTTPTPNPNTPIVSPEPTPSTTVTPTSGSGGRGSDTSDSDQTASSTEPSILTPSVKNDTEPMKENATTTTGNTTFTEETSFLQELSQSVGSIGKKVFEPITPYIAPIVEIINTKTGMQTSVGSGLFLAAFGLGRVPLSIANLYRSLYHLWSNFVGFVVFWKRRRAWGTVYDSETKAPLDPAYVELFDINSKKVAEAITDLDGRYGFVVDPGQYTMRVRKTNYVFPSRKYTLRDPDVLYSHLYFGGDVQVTDAVSSDIPMDPLSFDWNQYEKMRTKQTTFIHRFDPIIVSILNLLFYAGAAVAMWQVVVDPRTLTWALCLLYVTLFVLKLHSGGPVLYGHIKQNGKILPYAVVRAMQNNRVIKSAVTDSNGRYCILVHPGSYDIQVEVHQPNDTYTVAYTDKVVTKHGVINKTLIF